ncbi:GNAT family N-acetyltransferase [Paenibacillus thermoaerophilus]|uniref:GNAT family N-acetyltransferase n=1 Tax=Paenibacillus thermoaerophilus TaxID=1215385 RepID=A0ABW2V0T4_9BACL|nr:GNAT family N-acetyltransferase [Paenibacillus thermoaerophilus]TMV17777.1 GNAT family N-acetyltransferase [Paenibacillus thermoaerophilus]
METVEYRISDNKDELDLEAICRLLAGSYWAASRPRERIVASIRNSLCFGAYAPDGRQVGFLRVVTDKATFGWVCDVIVDPEHRGRGIGKRLLAAMLDHPELQGVYLTLGTRDAHGLYEQFGFTRRELMERRRSG